MGALLLGGPYNGGGGPSIAVFFEFFHPSVMTFCYSFVTLFLSCEGTKLTIGGANVQIQTMYTFERLKMIHVLRFFVHLTVKNCLEKWGSIYGGPSIGGGPFYWGIF